MHFTELSTLSVSAGVKMFVQCFATSLIYVLHTEVNSVALFHILILHLSIYQAVWAKNCGEAAGDSAVKVYSDLYVGWCVINPCLRHMPPNLSRAVGAGVV